MDRNMRKAYRNMGVLPSDADIDRGGILDAIDGSFSKAFVSDISGIKREVTVIDRANKASIVENLVKGAPAIGYSLESELLSQEQVTKTGKELKEKIALAIDYDNTEAAVALSEAYKIAKELDVKPESTTMLDSYDMKGMTRNFGVVPPMYSWEAIDEVGSSHEKEKEVVMESEESRNERHKERNELRNKMREYNKYIRNYVECRAQALLLGALVSSLVDDKKYKMSVRNAAQLGF